jgi:hypothetical protein
MAADPDMINKLPLAFKVGVDRIVNTVSKHLTPEMLLATNVMDVIPGDVLCDMFHTRVWVPFNAHIKDKDEDFFMNMEAASLGVADPILITLRASWGKMQDSEKADVWKNLFKLCEISARYSALKAA